MKRNYAVFFLVLLAVFLSSGCYDFVNATDRGSSSYQGWTVYDDPSLLELINPAAAEKILYYRDSCELLCSQILGITDYTFQVAEDKAFSSLVLNETVSDHRYEIDPSTLTTDITYYWRVKAGSADFTDPSTFQVAAPVAGDSMEGGIVFYVDTENWRGLVAAEEDLARAVWGETDRELGGFYSTGDGYVDYAPQMEELFTGNENTEAIVIAYADFQSYYAAKLCADLNLRGYNDWFLPSKMELEAMENALHYAELGNFESAYYWSSTEQGDDHAYVEYFGWSDNESDMLDKNKKNRVRPVRMFDYSANRTP